MSKIEAEDKLRPEYNVQNLLVRNLWLGLKKLCDTVRLTPDVLAVFPNTELVNEALRYVIEVAKQSVKLMQQLFSSVFASCLRR